MTDSTLLHTSASSAAGLRICNLDFSKVRCAAPALRFYQELERGGA